MALDKITMTGATKYTVKQGFTAVNQIIDDLASNETDQGASCIGIEDAAGNFAATTVEDALAEIGDDIESVQTVSDTFNEDTATTTGLTWGYKGGLLRTTSTVTTIADGTVSLTDDTTNYIEIGIDGTVYAVASAFTDGRLPIRTVVCASGVQTTSTDYRAYFTSVAVSTFMAGMLNDEDAAAVLASLSLDADLATFSLPASTTISAFAKTLLDDTSAKAARATLAALPAAAYELTDDATIAIDWDNGATQYVVLGATGRTVTFANPVNGAVYRFIIIQDDSGSQTITTWPTIKWAGGVAPTLSTALNAIDIVTLLYCNGVYYGDISTDFRTPA